jgi:hypothetical protein
LWCRHSPGLACRLSISYSIRGGAARRVFAIQSARGSPDWSSALISLPKSHSTRRIESVAPSIKRYDANLPTMICANRLAPAALFAIGCAGLPAVRTVQSQTYFKQTSSPAATHRLLRSLRGGNERISPSHSPTGSGRITRHSEVIPVHKSASRPEPRFRTTIRPSDRSILTFRVRRMQPGAARVASRIALGCTKNCSALWQSGRQASRRVEGPA